MKKVQISDSSLRNPTAHRSGNQRQKPGFTKQEANSRLPLSEVLRKLRGEAPLLYQMAKIVGKWVWIEFHEQQPREVTAILFGLGFHWNRKRQVWQHPCGLPCGSATRFYPREHYGCRAAAV
jgi:hypothetical protein